MTTISGYSQSSRNVVNASNQFTEQKNTLGTLQTQLASGKIAYTYAGLGAGAATSLSMNARLTTLNGYDSAITAAQTRVSLASTGLQEMSTLSSTLSTDLTGNYMTDLAQRGQVQTIAKGDFAEAVDTLNSDINGTYIFSGRATDTQPVASMDLILNGDPANGLDGVSQVVTQRITDDLGSGLGGLTNTVSGTTVTVGSEFPTSSYGMTVAASPAPASSTSAITVTTTGTPPSAAINVAAQPAGGDTISLTLTLPDGTTKPVTLTAGTVPGATAGTTFAIGATTADTAANIQAAMNTQLTTVATTDLPAASTMRASTDFFDGNYPADQVVQWYKGDSATDSPRETGSVQVSDSQTVAIGMRANEVGIRTTLASLAALAVTNYSTIDTTVVGPFNALATRTSAALVGPNGTDAIDGMTTDLANASVALGKASDRVSATTAQVQNSIASVEDADPTTIAANLLAVQTRLQASYQTTAAIAKLSLTDYL